MASFVSQWRIAGWTNVSLGRDVCRCTRDNKDTVVHLAPSRGHCMAFSSTIPPLQVALSFACSVASLSHSPSFQLPGWHRLHGGSLADYLLGWGRASTCTAGRAGLQCASMPKLPCGPQELPPSNQGGVAFAPVAWSGGGLALVSSVLNIGPTPLSSLTAIPRRMHRISSDLRS